MNLFETLSYDINPNESIDTFRKRLTGERIKMLEGSIQIHLSIIHDIEKDIETLKSQLHDTTKTDPHPASTIVDDDDVPTYSFV